MFGSCGVERTIALPIIRGTIIPNRIYLIKSIISDLQKFLQLQEKELYHTGHKQYIPNLMY
jgi:hypothetical protein